MGWWGSVEPAVPLQACSRVLLTGDTHRRQMPKLIQKFGRLIRIRLHWGRVGGMGMLRGIVGPMRARLQLGNCLYQRFYVIKGGGILVMGIQSVEDTGWGGAQCKGWGVKARDIP